MDRFTTIMQRRWLREGTDKPVPDSGIARFGFLLVTHAGKFVILNLLFIAFSLPIVTLPAALCGMNRVLVKLILDGNVFIWAEFIKEFRSSFRKSLVLGSIFGGGLFVAWYLLSIGAANEETIFGIVFFGLGLAALILSATLGGWVFVLCSMLPLGCGGLLKNARALAGLAIWRSVAICGILIASALLTFLLFPFSLFFTVLIQIAFTQYAVCFLAAGSVRHYIIEPYETAMGVEQSA